MQPLGAKKKLIRTKKEEIMQPRREKIIQSLGTENIRQPLRTKNHKTSGQTGKTGQPLDKKKYASSLDKKSQPLRTKKICNQKIMQPLGTKKNHATSLDKKK